MTAGEPNHTRIWDVLTGATLGYKPDVQGPAVLEGIGVVMVAPDATIRAPDGTIVWAPPSIDTDPAPAPGYRVPGLAYFGEAATADEGRAWTIKYEPDGTISSVWWNDGGFSFTPVATLVDGVYAADIFGAGHFVGTLAIADLHRNVVSPIDELVGPDDTAAYVIAAAAGEVARVNTPGDCLNIRELPSANSPIARCAADGALLWVTGEEQASGDATWLPVRGRAGATGFVDASFVTR